MIRDPQGAPVLRPPAEAVDDDAEVVAEDPCVVSWSHGREVTWPVFQPLPVIHDHRPVTK